MSGTKKQMEVHPPTARVIGILNILSEYPDGLTLTEISSATGFFKGTIHPVLQELIRSRYVKFNPDTKKYTLGIGACVLASRFMESDSAFKLIHDEMKQVVAICSEVCQLAVLDGGDVLYLAKVEAPQPIRLVSHVGKRLPANCTAIGKALLSQHSWNELSELYKDGLQTLTNYSIKTLEALFDELQEIRKTSFSFDRKESSDDVLCCAVPLYYRNKTVVAAISVSVPDYRLVHGDWGTIQKALIKAKKDIEYIINTGAGDFDFPLGRIG